VFTPKISISGPEKSSKIFSKKSLIVIEIFTASRSDPPFSRKSLLKKEHYGPYSAVEILPRTNRFPGKLAGTGGLAHPVHTCMNVICYSNFRETIERCESGGV